MMGIMGDMMGGPEITMGVTEVMTEVTEVTTEVTEVMTEVTEAGVRVTVLEGQDQEDHFTPRQTVNLHGVIAHGAVELEAHLRGVEEVHLLGVGGARTREPQTL